MAWCPKFFDATDPTNGADTVGESAREAAEQLYAKAAKLETGLMGVHLEDTRKLMKADREKVRQFEQQKLGIDTGGEDDDDMGDIIVTDDVHYHQQQRSNGWTKTLAAALVSLAVGGLGGWELYKAYVAAQPQPEPVVQGDRDTDTYLTLQFDEESEDN